MPETEGKTNFGDILKVSDIAAERIKQILEKTALPSAWVKISAKRDECGCIDYQLTLEGKPDNNEGAVKDDDLRIFIDEPSVALLRGAEMGFTETPEGEGFTFNNPNSEHTG